MTDRDNEIRQRCDRATPAILSIHQEMLDICRGDYSDRDSAWFTTWITEWFNAIKQHWPFDDIPYLLDRVAELEKENERLREAQRWIPCEERLPKGRGYYLSVVERIAPDELGGNNTRVKIMRWLGADWRYPTHIPKWINEAITETVTHWMPIPGMEGLCNDT